MAISFDEIGTFFIWDQVSLALRCVRRTIPVFDMSMEGSPLGSSPIVKVVEYVRDLISGDGYFDQAKVGHIRRPLEELKRLLPSMPHPTVLLNYHSVAEKTLAAAVSACFGPSEDASREVREALFAFCAAETEESVNQANAEAVQFDMSILAERAKIGEFSTETPVSQESFGPLWMTREPYSFPMQGDSGNDEVVIAIELPESATDAEVLAKIKELVTIADDLDRAYGGNGLQVSGLEALGEVSCLVGAK